MTDAVSSRDLVQSVMRGFAVISTFDADHSVQGLDGVAERSGISRSATRRLLQTLVAESLVAFDGRRYRLTARTLDLGYAAQSQLSVVEIAAAPSRDLSERTGCSVGLAQLDGAELLYLSRVAAPQYLELGLRVGSRLPAHIPALGRVQLAWQGDAAIETYLASTMFADHPAAGVESADALRADLARVRDKGWSHVQGAADDGLSAIAVPLRDRDGTVIAGLNIAGQDGLTPFRDLLEDLSATAELISEDLFPQ